MRELISVAFLTPKSQEEVAKPNEITIMAATSPKAKRWGNTVSVPNLLVRCVMVKALELVDIT
jgi:hypothetical protein